MKDHGRLIDETTFYIEKTLPGPIERVWDYLVDPERRAEWFAGGVFDLRPGGRAEFLFDHRNITPADDRPPAKYENYAGETRLEGKILKSEPPRLLVFEWPEMSGEITEVRIELTAKGGKVLLALTHSRLTKGEDLISTSAGWHAHLEILRTRLAGETPPPFWATHTEAEDFYSGKFAS